MFWFNEKQYGELKRSRPMMQTIRLGDMELEVWFLALDGEDPPLTPWPIATDGETGNAPGVYADAATKAVTVPIATPRDVFVATAPPRRADPTVHVLEVVLLAS